MIRESKSEHSVYDSNEHVNTTKKPTIQKIDPDNPE